MRTFYFWVVFVFVLVNFFTIKAQQTPIDSALAPARNITLTAIPQFTETTDKLNAQVPRMLVPSPAVQDLLANIDTFEYQVTEKRESLYDSTTLITMEQLDLADREWNTLESQINSWNEIITGWCKRRINGSLLGLNCEEVD